ncbi:hypothetical protein PFICI_07600 [Pestalotiopsis fici W106-1]|uniref:FAD-binding PCMH-type domain-containing protein n=1 Tax=Pestalotiopsis fici (strain W106-1 / CGMCC3.15140) TaxID=1229662 RepID=W3X4G8_PESFW|nr:uncharacterized protein PFICI_07600 [Pestalotiopsis fici W106-1]ETS80071.1 hypothetical protein PFICI_07600 [Pestalotiopsis fici W106-1]
MDPTIVLRRGTTPYNNNLKLYFNQEQNDRFPAEIHVAKWADDVTGALKRAQELKVQVGVRSGGHLPSKPSLVHDGILIDVASVNRDLAYDAQTHEVSFGPGVRVHEACKALDRVGRFFPFGHAPDVALGGFCLAGGQGFFMRGWGATITEWIVKMEIVVSDGRILEASRTQNPDLFWAARGGGQAFFGVVTRFWSRTIPKRNLFGRSFTFEVRDRFQDLLEFAFDRNDATPRCFTETAVCTLYPQLFDDQSQDENIPANSPLLLSIHLSAYADRLIEAETLLTAWNQLPDNIKGCLIEARPTSQLSWDEFFELQHRMNPKSPDQKWGINSILSDPKVSRQELVESIKPAMCNLPTRSSYGCIYMADTITPDESDAVFSLPQQYYISTFSGWKDPARKAEILKVMEASYKKAELVSCGMYVADFDQTSSCVQSRDIKVWTDSARARFSQIRAKWDSQKLFAGSHALISEN